MRSWKLPEMSISAVRAPVKKLNGETLFYIQYSCMTKMNIAPRLIKSPVMSKFCCSCIQAFRTDFHVSVTNSNSLGKKIHSRNKTHRLFMLFSAKNDISHTPYIIICIQYWVRSETTNTQIHKHKYTNLCLCVFVLCLGSETTTKSVHNCL